MFTTESELLSPTTTSDTFSLINSIDNLSLSSSSLIPSSQLSSNLSSRGTPSVRSFSTSSTTSNSGSLISATSSNHHRRISDGSHFSIISSVSGGQPVSRVDEEHLSDSGEEEVRGQGSSRRQSEDSEVILVPRTPRSTTSASPAISATSSFGEGSSIVGNNEISERKKKKTRRSGQRARKRLDNAQGREVDAVDSLLADEATIPKTPKKLVKQSKSQNKTPKQSQQVKDKPLKKGMGTPLTAARLKKQEEEEEEDEVDGLSDLGVENDSDSSDGETATGSGSGSGTSSRVTSSRRNVGSILSAEDARSSIDEFLSGKGTALTRSQKLRLWQSLAYELGLADLDNHLPPTTLPDLPISKPTKPTEFQNPSSRPLSPASSRSITPTLSRPMPQSLRQLSLLLKKEGHVNLADYFAARQSLPAGQVEKGGIVVTGRYDHLIFETSNMMMKYTRENKKFIKLGKVKEEALQPLLRDFGFKHKRERF